LTTIQQDRFDLLVAGNDRSWWGTVTIDHGAAMPLWRQLAEILRARIESGELPAGRVMPSETTLSQEYGLSRGTVVKALDSLERDGLVERIQGRGTFVVESPPAAPR
jgi:GntR family transcriptional regulator